MSPDPLPGPPPLRPARPLRWLRFGIAVFSLIVIAGYVTDTYRQVAQGRDAARREALERAETLLLALDEHLARTLQAASLVLDNAVERTEQMLREPVIDLQSLHGSFQDLQGRAPQLVNLGMIDTRGRVAIDTFAAAQGVDLSARGYFQTHARDPTTSVLLSPAVSSRATGRVFVPLSRRVDHPDGRFAGVVYGGLEPNYIESFYSRVQGGSAIVLAVYSIEGVLIARIPRRDGAAGGDESDSPLFTDLLPKAGAGTARLPADAREPARYLTYRRAADMPYVITASIAEDALLAGWRGQARTAVIQASLVLAAVLALTVFLVAMTYRRERMQADLQVSESRYRHFTESTSDWFWEVDASLRFTHFSGRFEQIFGIPPARLLGKTIEQMAIHTDTSDAWRRHLADLAALRPFRDFTYRPRTSDAREIWCRISGQPFFDEHGAFLGYRGTGRDVTAEVLAERRANEARDLLSNALGEIAEGFVLYDAEDRLTLWNAQYEKIHSATADLMVRGRRFEDIIRAAAGRGSVAQAKGRIEEWIAERLAAHRRPRGVHEQQFGNGRWVRIQETALADGGRVGIHTDITEIKAREAKLQELVQKNELLAAAIATTTSAVIITEYARPDNPIVYVNPAFTELTGYRSEDAIGRNTRFLRAPQTDPAAAQVIEAAWREGRAASTRLLNQRKDGRTYYADVRVSPVRDAAGRVTHFVGVMNDVTSQVRAEESLRENEERMRSLAENLPGITLQRVQKPDGAIYYSYISERTVEISGYTAQEFQADPELIWRLVDARDAPAYKAALARSAVDLKTADVKYRIRRRDGAERWIHGMFRPWRAANGDIIWDGLVFDVTERVEAEERIRESEARLRTLAENLPGVVYQRLLRADGSVTYPYVSRRALELTGYSDRELIDNPELLPGLMTTEFRAGYVDLIRNSAHTMERAQYEFRFVRRDGQERWARGLCQPRRLSNGDILWDGLVFDITEQKRMEQQRNELEAQLHHAQKIEALGTLAGGIAHDINNTLVPIVALGKLTLAALPEDSPHHESLRTILDAAYRVRDLVAEILAFSRKEMLRTEPTDLRHTVAKTVRLLSATLTPNVVIEQRMAEVGLVAADENQLVQVLMNLCTNAAHAIGSRQGRITIGLDRIAIAESAGSLAPGIYARLTVADTGCGMDNQTLQRIFEPFFTTKGVGEGTGLGLSVVHGIIANHHGRIVVESEPGRGTIFTILLPLAEASGTSDLAA